MKCSLIAMLGVLIISLVIVQSATAGQPQIACGEPIYNFGEAANIKTIKHTFVLRNEGNSPLIISSVKASCGCTTTNISNKTINPGEEANVDAELSLYGYQGYIKKDIRVTSNDPANSIFILSIIGNTIVGIEIKSSDTEVKIENNNIDFGYISENTAVSRSIDITTTENKPFQITKIEADPVYYDTNLETIETGKSYRLHINLKPQLSKKNLSDKIYIFTDNPNCEKIDITVLAHIFGIFTIIPEEIVLPAKTKKPLTQYLLVYSTENKPFEIKSVTAPMSSIQTEVLPMEKGYSIKISNINPVKELDGKNLRITTNLEEKKEILIPFRIISSEK